MRRKSLFFILLLFLVSFIILPCYASQSVPERVLSSSKSVVRILTEYKEGFSSGSGFVISNNRNTSYIATNYHVVKGSPLSISIWMDSERKISASIVAQSSQKDLCILQLVYPIDLKPLSFNSKDYKQGDAVYAVGFPSAADYLSDQDARTSVDATITNGIISAVRKATLVEYGSSVDLIQINAAINNGNSGGPLFDANGEVIGINTYGIIDAQGIFGAVSAIELEHIMLENGITPIHNAQHTTLLMILAAVFFLCIVLVFVLLRIKNTNLHNMRRRKTISLAMLIQEKGPFVSPDKTVSVLMPIALELKALHSEGKAHLEISPESIVFSNGYAKLLPSTGNESRRITSGFTSPEIYHGRNCGSASDIYSFCALLQYALSGIKPKNALDRVDSESVSLDSELSNGEDFDSILAAIIQKGMSLNAADRYDSMQTLIHELIPFNTSSAALSGTESPSVKSSTNKLSRKRKFKPVFLLILIPVFLLLFASVSWFTYKKSISLAESRAYSKAEAYIRFNPVVRFIDKDFYSYLVAGKQFEKGEYEKSKDSFLQMADYRDSKDMYLESSFRYAASLADANDFDAAIRMYDQLKWETDYDDVVDLIFATRFRKAAYQLYEEGEYKKALTAFQSLSIQGFSKADDMIPETKYVWANALFDRGEWFDAYDLFQEVLGYKSANDALYELSEIIYAKGQDAYHNGDFLVSAQCFGRLKTFRDSANYITLLSVLKYISKLHLGIMDAIRLGIPVIDSREKAIRALLSIIDFEDAESIYFEYF